ncbi:MAG TPA: GMC family oxidoreductase N-terminal domain-containing protein [Alphaproteobacteria bacterium]|nr:GMC family oxidoreductase N-terminal domain-containing protein [Alphaproteobacteria bacterium]
MADSENTFDFIVVGAGSAGCVVANRLSEDPGNRVCLIEAGPRDKTPLIHIPALVAALLSHPVVNWNFMISPQKNLSNREIPSPRGKVLGGTSSINGMVYFRGQPRDFDEWAAMGNPGWSYREVMPYFLRSENNEDYPAGPYHAKGGPLNVMFPRPKPNPLIKRFLDATDSLQYPRCDDYNGPNPEGFGKRQGTMRDGYRESTATAFLKPARNRENLTIVTEALVRRVVIENGRATGVEIEQDGQVRTVAAKREIVLSGGAYGSPQILLLSGVGDPEQLKKHGIAVVHELPGVGRNLHDHLATTIKMKTDNSESYGISVKAFPRGVWNVLQYAFARSGPFASNVYEAHGLVRSDPNLDRPDLQIVFIPAHRNTVKFPLPLGHGYGMNIVTLNPQSRGAVTLESADPRAAPHIDPNFLSAPEDIDPLVEGFKMSRRILACSSFDKLKGVEIAPGPQVQNREDIEAYIRDTAVTVFHPVGSCRMGPGPDDVVDNELKVRGIEGLRVADASIFPKITRGNTNAPVIMVGEKAADLVLGRTALQPADLSAAAE